MSISTTVSWRVGDELALPSLRHCVREGEVGVRGQREAYKPNLALRDNAVTQQRAMQLSDCLNCTLMLPAIEHSPHWRSL